MPGQIRAVPGTNTLYALFQATLFSPDNTSLWTPRWPNGARGPTTRPFSWTHQGGRWPARSGFMPASILYSGDAEPWYAGNQGCPSRKFIIGRCLDSVSAPVAGAIVQGFETPTDAYIGEVTAGADGNYELSVPSPAVQHYLVAYRAGPDIAGTTVNTLTGTNRDGT